MSKMVAEPATSWHPDQEVERGAERDRRAAITSTSTIISKAVSVAAALATIPLVSGHLGHERFGLWMTITSLTALLAFADLGLGNGLLSIIASAYGRQDFPAIRQALSSASAMMGMVGLLLVAVLVPLVLWIDLASAFGLREMDAKDDLKSALLCFVCGFVLTLQSAVAQRALSGLQLGYLNSAVSIVCSSFSVVGVLLTIRFDGGLPWLIVASIGIPASLSTGLGWLLLWSCKPGVLPKLSEVDWSTMRALAQVGLLFFVLQLASSLAHSADNLIVSSAFGAVAVGDFAVAAQLFGLVGAFVAIILAPMWPAYGEAIAAGDMTWVRRRLSWSVAVAALGAATSSMLLWAAFPFLAQWWLKRPIQIPAALLAGLAAWTTLSAIGGAVAMFLNGAGVVKQQVVVAVAFGAACLGIKLWIVPSIGLVALPWISAAVYGVVVLAPYGYMLPRIVSRIRPLRAAP